MVDSPRGIWEISDAGREYLLNNRGSLNDEDHNRTDQGKHQRRDLKASLAE